VEDRKDQLDGTYNDLQSTDDGEQRSLMGTIRERQRNGIGHILRGNSLLRTVLEGKIKGRRTRWKPKMKML